VHGYIQSVNRPKIDASGRKNHFPESKTVRGHFSGGQGQTPAKLHRIIAPNFEPDWNKPPTAPMLVAIRSIDGKRVPKMMKWGLIPHWAKDDKLQYSTFNARAEEFTTKPAFRDAWVRGQRCLVVTDGFYEWKKLDAKGKLKQPYAIAMADNAQMVMAGLWAKWKSPTSGKEVLSCTILTCGPNKAMGELHNRMPVILAEYDWSQWLGEEPACLPRKSTRCKGSTPAGQDAPP
jgi:putative SOS response-associated peptidase YedK